MSSSTTMAYPAAWSLNSFDNTKRVLLDSLWILIHTHATFSLHEAHCNSHAHSSATVRACKPTTSHRQLTFAFRVRSRQKPLRRRRHLGRPRRAWWCRSMPTRPSRESSVRRACRRRWPRCRWEASGTETLHRRVAFAFLPLRKARTVGLGGTEAPLCVAG